jgi:hypothetical protein
MGNFLAHPCSPKARGVAQRRPYIFATMSDGVAGILVALFTWRDIKEKLGISYSDPHVFRANCQRCLEQTSPQTAADPAMVATVVRCSS